MFGDTKAFSSFAAKDLAATKDFYANKLGMDVKEMSGMGLTLNIPGCNGVFIYAKPDHEPATYTILNFPVDNIEAGVKQLADAGIELQHYDGMTDESGIARGLKEGKGPDIAWFKDPSGNVLSVLQQA